MKNVSAVDVYNNMSTPFQPAKEAPFDGAQVHSLVRDFEETGGFPQAPPYS